MGREGSSSRVPGAQTGGGGEGAPGHLAESVWVTAVFGSRRRRPLLSGRRASPSARRGPGRKFARAARSACPRPCRFRGSAWDRGEGIGVGGGLAAAGVGTSPEARPAATPSAAASARTPGSGPSRSFLFVLAEIPRDRSGKSLAAARHGAPLSLDCT